MAMITDQIANSFITLLETKTYNNITIRMICDGVPTSRNTFYYYFDNKEQLVEWICCRDFMKHCFPFFNISADNVSTQSFFSYILKNKRFYFVIYEIEGGNLLRNCLNRAYDKAAEKENIGEFAHLANSNKKKIDIRVYRSYGNSGIAAVVIFWIGDGMKIPISDMAADLKVMLTNSLEEARDNYLF